MRFWPGWAWLKDLKAQGTYGDILTARFRRVSAPPGWSRDSYFKGGDSGGALFDLHVHDTDFVQFLFGRPTAVFSTGVSRFSGAIDHVVTQYMVPGGATVYAEGSWLMASGFSMSYTVMFERATIDYDGSRGDNALQVLEEGKDAARRSDRGARRVRGRTAAPDRRHPLGHAADGGDGAGRPERRRDLRGRGEVRPDRSGGRPLIRAAWVLVLLLAVPGVAPAAAQGTGYAQLLDLFREWRAFEEPPRVERCARLHAGHQRAASRGAAALPAAPRGHRHDRLADSRSGSTTTSCAPR